MTWILLALAGGAALLLWPKSIEFEAAVGLNRFMAACRRAGMTQGDAFADLRIRQALAVVRREASAIAERRPWDAERAIVESAQNQALALACISKDDAKRFVAWVENLDEEDILYRAALRAVRRHRASLPDTLPRIAPSAMDTADVLAATRTRR